MIHWHFLLSTSEFALTFSSGLTMGIGVTLVTIAIIMRRQPAKPARQAPRHAAPPNHHITTTFIPRVVTQKEVDDAFVARPRMADTATREIQTLNYMPDRAAKFVVNDAQIPAELRTFEAWLKHQRETVGVR